MGRVRVDCGKGPRDYELSRSTVVGRHPLCLIWMNQLDVPGFWLEIRYTADQWVWRPFREDDRRTTGTGPVVRDSWRALLTGRASRIGCHGGAWLQLIDDQPPRSFAVDLASGDECVGEAFAHLAEAFRDEGLVGLEEFGVYVLNERPWRVFPVTS